MQKEACFYIGFIAKKHSFNGLLSIKLDGTVINNYENLEFIYIEIEGQLIFYRIENSSIQKKIFLKIKLEDIDNDNAAKALIKKNVYVLKKNVTQLKSHIFFNFQITDFKVQNKEKKYIGLVHEVNILSTQPILIVLDESKKEIMIPLVDNFIVNVSKKNKIITVDLPEGLIDIN